MPEMSRKAVTPVVCRKHVRERLSPSFTLSICVAWFAQDMVTKHQHLISLSVKIVNVLVKASALGCGINLIPHVDISDHNELLTALQTHLLEVQAHA